MSAVAHRLDPLELASGIVLGLEPDPPPLPRVERSLTPRAALEAAVLPALRRAPCLVSFSGGRDSSTVLAAATALARREGLPPPIPATNVFPAAPRSDESGWQEQVVRRLGLTEWARLEHRDELDCVGPVARDLLRRHGLLWPFNAHFHAPLVRAAAGGSLLTGIGGDELLGTGRLDRVGAVWTLRVRPEWRDLRRTAYALAPRALRSAFLRRSGTPQSFRWLRPAAAAELLERWAADAAVEPLRWSERLRLALARRYLRVGNESLALIAGDHGVHVSHPLTDPRLAAALAGLPWRGRYRSRSEAVELLAGDLLPDELRTRADKACFDEAFWAEHSRRFAASWDGAGVDAEVVDADGLRAEWASERPRPQSFLLLQSVWLEAEARRSAGERGDEELQGLVQRLPAARTA